MPEMFVYEIGKLTDDERSRFRRRRFELFSNDGVILIGEQYQMALLNQTYEQDKIQEMKLYAYFQRMEFKQRYETFLCQAKEWGWDHLGEYIHSIKVRDKNSLTSIEKIMLEEILELDQIEEEILTLEKALQFKEEPVVLPYPMDEKDKREFLRKLEYVNKFKTMNILDTPIIPYQFPEETFDDRLRKIPGIDIDEEIRICKQ